MAGSKAGMYLYRRRPYGSIYTIADASLERASILAMLLWLSAQQANRQVTPGTEIPSTGAEYTFQHVVGMDIGPDGFVLILDPTEKAVLRFGPRGEYRGRLGKEGAGPGEFRWPMQMGILKDEVWVHDMQLRRINVFDKSQSLLRTQRQDKSGLVPLLDGGAMVVQPFEHPPHPSARVDTATVSLLLIHADKSQDRIASWLIDPNQVTVNSPGFTAVARQPLVDAPLWDAGWTLGCFHSGRAARGTSFIGGGIHPRSDHISQADCMAESAGNHCAVRSNQWIAS